MKNYYRFAGIASAMFILSFLLFTSQLLVFLSFLPLFYVFSRFPDFRERLIFVVMAIGYSIGLGIISCYVAEIESFGFTVLNSLTYIVFVLFSASVSFDQIVKRQEFEDILVKNIIILSAGYLFLILLFRVLHSTDIVHEYFKIMENLKPVLQNKVSTMFKDSDSAVINGYMTNLLTTMELIFPSIVIITGAITIISTYIFSNIYNKNLFFDKWELNRFKLSDYYIFGFIISFVLLFANRFINNIYLKSISYNLVIIFLFIYFLQGIFILNFFLVKWRVPKVLRAIIYLIILYPFYLINFVTFFPFLIGIGIFDIWLDFRKLYDKDKMEE